MNLKAHKQKLSSLPRPDLKALVRSTVNIRLADRDEVKAKGVDLSKWIRRLFDNSRTRRGNLSDPFKEKHAKQ